MIATRLRLPLSLLCIVVLAGCQGPSYVNIPRESGDIAFNSPNGRTVRAVVAKAVDAIIVDTPIQGPVALRLPEKSDALTYEGIATETVSKQIVPAAREDEAAADLAGTIKVTQVRVRGHKAEVDAIRAKAGGAEQLVTVYLSWSAFSDGWHSDRIRPWRIPVTGKPV